MHPNGTWFLVIFPSEKKARSHAGKDAPSAGRNDTELDMDPASVMGACARGARVVTAPRTPTGGMAMARADMQNAIARVGFAEVVKEKDSSFATSAKENK